MAGYFAASPAHLWTEAPSLVVEPTAPIPSQSQWQSQFASDADTRMVHAASMVELEDGTLRAFWFAGSREGAADVAIHTAVFDPATATWSDEVPVVTRAELAKGWNRHIRKLGNAVPVIDDDGRMRLFVVAVSFGGWGGSRIVALESFDQGATWQFDTALATSPFLNISTLVKTPAIRYSDGTIGLPVYHEMLGKFGEILRLDRDNHILDKARIGHGRKAIQPLVLVDSSSHAVAFLRNENEPNNGYAYQTHSKDGGRHWQSLEYSPLENPSAALGGVAMGPGHWLIAANCNRYERDDLCIRETRDGGRHWENLWFFHDRAAWRGGELAYEEFEDLVDDELVGIVPAEQKKLLTRVRDNKCQPHRGCEFQYDYPYMIRARNGDLHMLYTWNKSAIRHAWLKADDEQTPRKERRHDT